MLLCVSSLLRSRIAASDALRLSSSAMGSVRDAVCGPRFLLLLSVRHAYEISLCCVGLPTFNRSFAHFRTHLIDPCTYVFVQTLILCADLDANQSIGRRSLLLGYQGWCEVVVYKCLFLLTDKSIHLSPVKSSSLSRPCYLQHGRWRQMEAAWRQDLST
ncbi:hypothetical protein MPTK1_3g19260 [Marchantia polymorpha subsp. ruderalis]|uniref:Uncharacterized protein n=2 Tax=Marchantia polymorpha TaxID=3197 RepID=A0AAF6B2H7_MARPO|nr:hypothetical protein MARPO_0049s0108 [Marchantia polymorpha]BBN06211.1 hypothetical protein Mp_3g19260 [Marchantia polymorpha subsp. ruderalis]|eukprot:PTQ38832.1 hypothetical protein MARPO_0049s0108 [Marchantia polymorpha]